MFRPTLLLIFTAFTSVALAQSDTPAPQGPPNVPEFAPAFPEQTRAPAMQSSAPEIAIFVDKLEHPWGMAELPGGGLLVTERAGRLRHVSADGALSEPIKGLPNIWAGGQGGMLDVAIGPTFADDRLIYWTYAKATPDNMGTTAAARGRLSEDLGQLTDVQDIFVQTPASRSGAHFGSRIVFDDAGHTFITTGDRGDGDQAQDLSRTIGKVIRVTLDGKVPPDNPFANQPAPQSEIWSYGHRNVQGATIGPDGALWTIEHGPKGGDELNRPEPGKNYGWPVIGYGEDYSGLPMGDGLTVRDGMEQPVYYWDPVIAPGGMAFYSSAMFPDWNGDLLIGSLNPGELVRLRLADGKVVGEERILRGIGRIRDVEVMADGSVLLAIDAPNGGLLRLSR